MRPHLCSSLLLVAAGLCPLAAQQPAAPAPKAGSSAAASSAASAPATGADFKKVPDHVELKDGDTWVFLGDSITHQCLYTQYVEDYFYTRYPKMRVHFHNAGVGGDRASDALARFDDDVAALKPKYVTILLGMNDGGYTNYQQPIFDTYQKDMTTLLERLSGIGATAIPMTPTMFDSRASKLTPRSNEVKEMYYNGVLSLFGSWLREQAYGRGLGFVDMWSPLNDLTIEQRKKDAKWTMIPDAVHPAATGQVVMAVAVIENIVQRTQVSQIVVDQQKGQMAVHAARGVAGPVQKTDNGLTFDFTAESLPWVLPSDAAEGLALTHAGHHDSNEKITVRDLPPRKYELKIDGQPVGTYTSAQLAFGVELEGNDKTPEYQQALKVATLNKQRNDESMHPLRDQWREMKMKRRELALLESNKSPTLEAKKGEFEQWREGFKGRVEALLAKTRQFEDQIYQANQPVAHHYELVAAP